MIRPRSNDSPPGWRGAARTSLPERPTLGQIAARLIGIVSDAIGSSSMRLGAAPTVAILLVLLVLLSLIARPGARWAGADLGRLAALGRVMALAAESGADAAISLGSAGV